MRKKFKARYIVIPVICLALVGGVGAVLVNKAQSDAYVKVVPVDQLNMDWGFDSNDLEVYGSIKKGSVQNVILDEELKVDKVNVKKGDTVKKGDMLFTYDTRSLELNVEEVQSRIDAIANDQKIANNQLDVLKKLQPSENAPKEAEPDYTPAEQPDGDASSDSDSDSDSFKYEKKISLSSKPLGGTGSSSDPFVFNAGEDTVVLKEYMEYLSGGFTSVQSEDDAQSAAQSDTDSADNTDTDSDSAADSEEDKGGEPASYYALINVYDESGELLYGRLIDGSKITQSDIADWRCTDGVTVNEDGTVICDQNKCPFASFITYIAQGFGDDIDTELYGDMEDSFSDYYPEPENDQPDMQQPASDEITLNDNYIYSKAELQQMISEKEKEIEKLGFDKKQADIDLQAAQMKLEKGGETAEVNGKVTYAASSETDLSENGAYMILTSDEGMSVVGSVSEFNLDDVYVGQEVKVTNNADGSIYDGKITEIADTPSSSADEYYYTDTTSYYDITVSVSGSPTFKDDDGANVLIPLEEDGSLPYYIEAAFLREEGGRYYVMLANDDDIIEKRYVKTGANYYGYVIEVKSGLSDGDRLALPYGNTKEGMPTVDADYDDLNGFFF